MKTKKIACGKIKFPRVWVEFNSRYAQKAIHVAICTDGVHVGIYYTPNEASKLTESQMAEIDAYAEILGFSKDYRVYGLIEQDVIADTMIRNAENAELIKD